MPQLLDPDSRFSVVLESDKDKDDPPTFVFRALSVRSFNRAVDQYESIDEGKSESSKMKTIIAVLCMGLIDWHNMGRDYDPAELDDILTIGEAIELLEKMLGGQSLSGDDAKN